MSLLVPASRRCRAGVLAALALLSLAAGPASAPADPQLWAEMQQVNAAGATASAITADFRQEKFTPLMRKPLVSGGRVVARGGVSLWTTTAPRPSTMRVTPDQIRIYYPDQAVVESYPVQGQLGALAASPLPKLDTLATFFTFAREASTDTATLALKLTPSTDDLRQHVREVHVQLDRVTGAIRRTETVDADGDRTVLTFDHVNLKPTVTDGDLELRVPAGTRQVEPLGK